MRVFVRCAPAPGCLRGWPVSAFSTALDDLHHVGLALAQVVVLDALELLDQRFGLLRQRPLGVQALSRDELARNVRQRAVLQDHQVQIEKALELRR